MKSVTRKQQLTEYQHNNIIEWHAFNETETSLEKINTHVKVNALFPAIDVR